MDYMDYNQLQGTRGLTLTAHFLNVYIVLW